MYLWIVFLHVAATFGFVQRYLSLLVLLVSGIVAGSMGRWWSRGWIWTSLGVLLAIMIAMTAVGTLQYGKVRKARRAGVL